MLDWAASDHLIQFERSVTVDEAPDLRIDLPKASQVIASTIRRKIITGEYKEGDNLPPENELTKVFGVSRPSLREAYRILESESLIVVKRGTHGGARIQAPRIEVAARYIGYLLQVKGATMKDVHLARVAIEPLAAQSLAQNWSDEIAAELQEALDEEAAAIDDSTEYTKAALRFHKRVVGLLQNPVFEVILSTVAEVIDLQADEVTRSLERNRSSKDAQASHRAHLRLFDLMRDGAAEDAQQHWRSHLEASVHYLITDADTRLLDLFK